MRNMGSCQWSLFGRLLMFAMRNAGCRDGLHGHRPIIGAPRRAVAFVRNLRTAA